MDSNVSKKTFLHKFFKLVFNYEATSLSIEELLQQRLLSTLKLFQQSNHLALDRWLDSTMIGTKITLLYASIESISSNRKIKPVLSTSKSLPIIYSCSIALPLAALTKKKSQVVAKELLEPLISRENNFEFESTLNLTVALTKSGLISFGLDSKSVAIWLNKSLILASQNIESSSDLLLLRSLESTPTDLFPAQYIHARCCTLLRLGDKKLPMSIQDVIPISWIDELGCLWLRTEIELILLGQLFLVTDSFANQSANWRKLALNLSEVAAIFLAKCRFIDENKYIAIARLSLIKLTQYWLKRLLVEKLNVVAPTSL